VDGAGTLQGRWSLAGGRTAGTGCSICRGPVLPGLRLCGACRAALKRARHATVSEELTAPSASARRRKASVARAQSSQQLAPARRNAGSKRAWTVIAAIAAVAAGSFVALHVARPGQPVPVVPSPSALATASVAPKPAPVPETSKVRAEFGATVAPPVSTRVAPLPNRAATAKRAPESLPAPTAPVQERFPAATETPPPMPTPQAAVAEPPQDPAPDRWQRMANEAASCGSEGFLARVVCEERIRLRYCEGHWGQAERCPVAAVANDHGR
jgi:hypothetical protein